jgi:tetratricopeptide (TPR) repeat protein
MTGYSRSVGATTQRRLEEAYADLLGEGKRREAEEVATDLLERNPDLAPARVLRAQSEFIGGSYATVAEEMESIAKSYPDYVAAQLLYGRTSEKLGNLVEGLDAYRRIADTNQLAQSRVADLAPRTVEIMALRIEDAVAKGHTGAAKDLLDELLLWAPEEDRTLEVAAKVYRATGETQAELQILRRLSAKQPEDRMMSERRAELELEIGDPAAGMRVFEQLAERYPDDPEVVESLVRARFLWRFQLLPPDVRQLSNQAELTRGEVAVLLYWLFPDIRYGAAGGARIANDVLEHPNREQIVRVVNSRILDVDPSLHRFEPYRPITRRETLTAMLRLLARKAPPLACLGRVSVPRSSQALCVRGAACGLLDEEAACLPNGPVSGQEAMEFCRVTQELLGVQ